MPWSGGAFTRDNGPHSGSTCWASSAAAGTGITTAEHDEHDQDLAAGISFCLNKDGSTVPSAHIQYLATHSYVATTGGSSNNYTVTLSPAAVAYYGGMLIRASVNHTNSGASTLNVNGLGTRNILRKTGQALSGNELISGQFHEFLYDGTSFRLMSELQPMMIGPFVQTAAMQAGIGTGLSTLLLVGDSSGTTFLHVGGPKTIIGMSVRWNQPVGAGTVTLTLYKSGATTGKSITLTTGNGRFATITPETITTGEDVGVLCATDGSYSTGFTAATACNVVLWAV